MLMAHLQAVKLSLHDAKFRRFVRRAGTCAFVVSWNKTATQSLVKKMQKTTTLDLTSSCSKASYNTYHISWDRDILSTFHQLTIWGVLEKDRNKFLSYFSHSSLVLMESRKCCSSYSGKEPEESPSLPPVAPESEHHNHSHEIQKPGCESDCGCEPTDTTTSRVENCESAAGEMPENSVKQCCSLVDNFCSCDENCLLDYAAVLCRSRCDDSNRDADSETRCCNINGSTSALPNINWTSKSQHSPHDENEAHHHHHNHGHGHQKARYAKASACSKCYVLAKNAAFTLTTASENLVKKCYCSLMKDLRKSSKNAIPGTQSQVSLAQPGGCCQTPEKDTASSCCSRHSHSHHGTQTENAEISITMEDDLPPRFLSLGVTGMTCTGCADKVVHALKSTSGVQTESVNVNFLMGRADLSFLPDFTHENEIMEKLKRSTGFRVVILDSGDIRDAGLAKAWISVNTTSGQHQTIEGIDGIAKVKILETTKGRQLFEVAYDPTVIGIRNMLALIDDKEHGVEASIVTIPSEEKLTADLEKSHIKILGWKTVIAAVLTIPVLILAWARLNTPHPSEHIIQVFLATAVMATAHNIYQSAWGTIVRGGAGGKRIDMDVLITVATGGAWAASVAILTISGRNRSSTPEGEGVEPFFETCCLLVTLILTGRWATAKVRMWALKRVVDVGEVEGEGTENKNIPDAMLFIEGETPQATSYDSLQYGDVLVVGKGDAIPTDGVVVEGEAEVDESLLTGESKPAVMKAGSLVMAGSTVVTGSIRFRLTRLPHENTIAVIRRMVRSTGGEKPKIQEIADKVALYLTPIILGVAAMVFIVWLLFHGLARHKTWGKSAVIAITYAVATLAVSCPCAIGLVVPMVIVFTSRIGIRKCGLLLVNPKALERGWKAKKVVFDKTGTLTMGKLNVVSAKCLLNGEWSDVVDSEADQLIRTLCKNEKHPVARALATKVGAGKEILGLEVETVIGKGLQAISDSGTIRCGQPSWTATGGENHPMVLEIVEQGLSVFTISIDHTLRAVFGLEDTIRPEAMAVIAELRRREIDAYIFSGDHKEAVRKVAIDLGLSDKNYRYGCSPDQKSAEIKSLQEASPGTVLFLGDGTNDAVALTQADVGFSFGDSTEVAVSASDIAVLSTSLNSIPDFLDLCVRVKRCILAGFYWAIIWNLFAVLAAAGAFVKFRIEPQWAGLGELGSVLPVVLIAALVGIRWHKISASSPPV
ncbi:heavy metal translocatin [Choiromyces venosus 120613-1]|uniref:Heavy metal translocatin n=1 Tax=Choiromyces venosus 120613-1 TaxID=1336337 RepID=A0A3N4K6H1_9PEZI|nr:heavy metal translocatin [Choiromyces venosus 120613-1]